MCIKNVSSSVCEMQENNSERNLKLCTFWHGASCAHDPCGKVLVLPDLHRKKKKINKQGQAQKKHSNTQMLCFITPKKKITYLLSATDHFINSIPNGLILIHSRKTPKCCYGYKWGSDCCSVHTWNDNLWDSLMHLNAVVTPETCSVYVANNVLCPSICVCASSDVYWQPNNFIIELRSLHVNIF